MEKPRKQGYKTTEFWISFLALLVGTLIASGYIGEDGMAGKVLAFGASALTALGYTISRGIVKKAEALSDAVIGSEEEDSD